MAYALAALVILGLVIGISLVRGQRRREREMQALRAVMQQALNDEPEKPGNEDS